MQLEENKNLEKLYHQIRYDIAQEDDKDRENSFVEKIKVFSLSKEDEEQLRREIFLYGPLEEFLEDESITEIMINGHEDIWIDTNGNLVKSSKKFLSEKSLYDCVQRLLSKVGRKGGLEYSLCRC